MYQRAKSIPPAIPYCGLLSKDLFAVQENNRSDVVESPSGGGNHVNVDKLRLIWDKLESFVKLQYTTEYDLFFVFEKRPKKKKLRYSRCVPNSAVQAFLLRLGDKQTGGFLFLDPASYKSVSLALEKKSTGVVE